MPNIAVYIVNKTYQKNHFQAILMWPVAQMDSFEIMSAIAS